MKKKTTKIEISQNKTRINFKSNNLKHGWAFWASSQSVLWILLFCFVGGFWKKIAGKFYPILKIGRRNLDAEETELTVPGSNSPRKLDRPRQFHTTGISYIGLFFKQAQTSIFLPLTNDLLKIVNESERDRIPQLWENFFYKTVCKNPPLFSSNLEKQL